MKFLNVTRRFKYLWLFPFRKHGNIAFRVHLFEEIYADTWTSKTNSHFKPGFWLDSTWLADLARLGTFSRLVSILDTTRLNFADSTRFLTRLDWIFPTRLDCWLKIALAIISTPVTEVSVERLFNHLKFIQNKHRFRLSGPLLEDILFLRMNNVFRN